MIITVNSAAAADRVQSLILTKRELETSVVKATGVGEDHQITFSADRAKDKIINEMESEGFERGWDYSIQD